MSPLVRRVVNETLAAALNTGVFDAKIKTMFQTYTMPAIEMQQTVVQHDALRNNLSDNLENSKNTILFSQYVVATFFSFSIFSIQILKKNLIGIWTKR